MSDSNWNDGLTGVALNIAATNQSPLRVLAGPGTGKTYAMKRRVMRLLQEGGNPHRILACTFTRTAARDIAREIATLGAEGADKVWAGTLHGLCFSILQRNAVLQATGRVARPLAQTEERFLLQDLSAGFGGVKKAEKKLDAFSAAWARRQSDEPGWPTDPVDKAFQEALDSWLRFHRAMLIGEIVPVALHYLLNNPACEERSRFDHVIVDEFQDLNRAEQDLVDLLAGKGSLTIIGDEDQSIYSFKHAHPEGIVSFDGTHPGTHDETLDVCRRCPTNVVQLATELIGHNKSASGRPLQPNAGNGPGVIHIVQWYSLVAETDGIADYVLQRIKNDKVNAGDVLILANRRQIGYAVRDALRERAIVAHSFFNEQALHGNPKRLDECQAQEAFALLVLLADPHDRVALRTWCGFGSGNLNEKGWARIRAVCESEHKSPRAVLEMLAAGQLKIQHTANVVARFKLLQQREASLKGLVGKALADALFPEAEEWALPLRSIVTEAFQTDQDHTASELLDEVRVGVTQMETPTNVDFVRVMSLHKSKGLTARLVVVMACNEGIIPKIDYAEPQSVQDMALEEQRRLFYVALTRTTETLVLSSVSSISTHLGYAMGMGISAGQASRFIAELGPTRPKPIAGEDFLAN